MDKPKEIRLNTENGTKRELHLWLLQNYKDAPAITNVLCALINALKEESIQLVTDPSTEFGYSVSHPNSENLMSLVVKDAQDSTKVNIPFTYPKELESEVIAFNSSLMITLGWLAKQGEKDALGSLLKLISDSGDSAVMEEATNYAASLLESLNP